MLVLGIETSCDETAVALVEDGVTVRSNVIGSQIDHHRPFGGVVPEIAARAHLEMMLPTIGQALVEAGATYDDLEGVAVTAGPGLVGALLVGVAAAKSISLAHDIPLIGVNHLEGHVCATQLEHGLIDPPMLALIVSGGHTSLVLLDREGGFTSIGATIDDAAGEAFDKVARFIGLPFPGGPEIDRLSRDGDPTAIAFPRAMLNSGNYDFSMSGLKTAVIRELRRMDAVGEEIVLADVAASFTEAITDVLVTKTIRAAEEHDVERVTLVGGVAANSRLREALADRCRAAGRRLLLPQPVLCTDNGAMIAAAGFNRLAAGQTTAVDLDADPSLGLHAMPIAHT
ncbi:tRNA (adenosine(37)-N6)-threonylcarbamoyltransferase complex transferase subunit TsaD [Euzebya tangerina]|uniref:tRNA (adenosine(37)-N6)-threonylcarbamoyltransferase complex transferase subunit TsaD n=1 Tax=Euzebya tangerina TaxID=591198 RepID=UPI00196B8909|nr:tRNA (adenosine(37)-N6)-threonylcarbamoyltransferase complex transferase subunit TsaD [Euzebya tangerina]